MYTRLQVVQRVLSFFTEDDAKNRDMQMNYSALRMLLPVMMDAADVPCFR